MAKIFYPQIVTANDLVLGDAVYWTAQGDWSRSIKDALIGETEEMAKAILAEAAMQQHIIVGAYLMDVETEQGGKPVPIHFREVFRTRGPSNYFHGKQVEA